MNYYCIMQRSSRSFYLFLGLAALLAGTAGIAIAQTKTVKVVPVQPTATISGSDLYREYCAVCHGTDGKGAGPAAAALKEKPTDLTQISRRNSGKFPALRIRTVIEGQDRITAHGSEEMPVWGSLFRSLTTSDSFVELRVQALLQYLEQIQR